MGGIDKLQMISGVLASTDKVVDMPADGAAASKSSKQWPHVVIFNVDCLEFINSLVLSASVKSVLVSLSAVQWRTVHEFCSCIRCCSLTSNQFSRISWLKEDRLSTKLCGLLFSEWLVRYVCQSIGPNSITLTTPKLPRDTCHGEVSRKSATCHGEVTDTNHEMGKTLESFGVSNHHGMSSWFEKPVTSQRQARLRRSNGIWKRARRHDKRTFARCYTPGCAVTNHTLAR